MEIPSRSYFLFWATISIVFTRLGFNALNKTELSNSVSPLFMSLFKHSLAFSASLSSVSAFLFFPRLKITIHKFLVLYGILLFTIAYYAGGSSAYWYFSIFAAVNLFEFFVIVFEPSLAAGSEFIDGVIVHLVVGSSMVLAGHRTRFFPCALLSIGLLIALSWLTISENAILGQLWPPLVAKAKQLLSMFMVKRKGKLVEFAAAMVGTILFQNYFRLTSFDHVVAFLYFAVAWLANLALTRGYGDLGIFNFLLSNVMVGCTVSQFGLRGTTWIVYAASLLLFGLRLKLESLDFAINDRQVEIIVW